MAKPPVSKYYSKTETSASSHFESMYSAEPPTKAVFALCVLSFQVTRLYSSLHLNIRPMPMCSFYRQFHLVWFFPVESVFIKFIFQHANLGHPTNFVFFSVARSTQTSSDLSSLVWTRVFECDGICCGKSQAGHFGSTFSDEKSFFVKNLIDCGLWFFC